MTDHEKFKSMLRAQDQAGLAEYGCKEPVTPREIVFWVRAGIDGSPVYPPHGIPPVDTTTRSEAWAIGDGSVVVLIAGITGGVWLSHVEVLP